MMSVNYFCDKCSAVFLEVMDFIKHSNETHRERTYTIPSEVLPNGMVGQRAFSTDPILRELIEETITKSHREWRSIPETVLLVLRAVEDYTGGK